MRTNNRVLIRVAFVLVLAAVVAMPRPAKAGFILVTSESALGANDSIDWGSLGTLTTPGFSLTTADGNYVNGTIVGFANVGGLTSFGIGQLNGFPAVFGSAVDSQGVAGVSITLTFAQPVSGFGAVIENSAGDEFMDTYITATDTNGNTQTFGTNDSAFTLPGGGPGFVGVSNDTANISSVTYTISDGGIITNYSSGELIIGQAALASPTESSVPEPTSLTLVGLGIIGLLGYNWRRRKRAAT